MRRRLVGIDLGIVSDHTVRVLDERGGEVCRRRARPTVESLAAVEAAVLVGTGAGVRLEVVIEPTGPAWLPIAVFFSTRGHAVFRVSSQKAARSAPVPVPKIRTTVRDDRHERARDLLGRPHRAGAASPLGGRLHPRGHLVRRGPVLAGRRRLVGRHQQPHQAGPRRPADGPVAAQPGRPYCRERTDRPLRVPVHFVCVPLHTCQPPASTPRQRRRRAGQRPHGVDHRPVEDESPGAGRGRPSPTWSRPPPSGRLVHQQPDPPGHRRAATRRVRSDVLRSTLAPTGGWSQQLKFPQNSGWFIRWAGFSSYPGARVGPVDRSGPVGGGRNACVALVE